MDTTPTKSDSPSLLRRIDSLLRQAAGGRRDTSSTPTVRELVGICVACGAVYGIAMGLYAASMRGWPGTAQMLAAAVKVPLLFLLTLGVTFPSFYVLCAVSGAASSGQQLLRVQLVGTALMTALLASLGPITIFFTLSTDSHGFMVLLSTLFFAVAGAVGLRAVWSRGRAVLLGTQDKASKEDKAGAETEAEGNGNSENNTEAASRGLGLLRAWFMIAIAVGAQSAWILRPIIGLPDDRFALFAPRESNAFAGFFDILGDMIQ